MFKFKSGSPSYLIDYGYRCSKSFNGKLACGVLILVIIGIRSLFNAGAFENLWHNNRMQPFGTTFESMNLCCSLSMCPLTPYHYTSIYHQDYNQRLLNFKDSNNKPINYIDPIDVENNNINVSL